MGSVLGARTVVERVAQKCLELGGPNNCGARLRQPLEGILQHLVALVVLEQHHGVLAVDACRLDYGVEFRRDGVRYVYGDRYVQRPARLHELVEERAPAVGLDHDDEAARLEREPRDDLALYNAAAALLVEVDELERLARRGQRALGLVGIDEEVDLRAARIQTSKRIRKLIVTDRARLRQTSERGRQ